MSRVSKDAYFNSVNRVTAMTLVSSLAYLLRLFILAHSLAKRQMISASQFLALLSRSAIGAQRLIECHAVVKLLSQLDHKPE